jgi:glycerol-3-phosphate acyltransferase PlsX
MATAALRIALDAMGGDVGLPATVEAAARLSLEERHVVVLLVGEPDAIRAELARHPHRAERIEVEPARGVVSMDDDPREALDRLPDCSIATAARLVAAGAADAMVSAGSTGATILASARYHQRLPGIRRAALAAVYPTERRHGPRQDPFALILDVGATLQASAEDLVSFAVMGSAYARIVSDNPSPSVALLSNGTEAHKGTEAIVEAHQRLRTHPALNFHGNVEGLDIPRGTTDVIVTEGFLGNVVLKMFEGVSEVATGLARDAWSKNLLWKLGLTVLSPEIKELRRLTDWKQYGGAPLLGLDKVVIKAHGRSDARALRNALRVASKAVERDLASQIREGLRLAGA